MTMDEIINVASQEEDGAIFNQIYAVLHRGIMSRITAFKKILKRIFTIGCHIK